MTKDTKWDATKIPSLVGKIAVVTGCNSGIGFVAALELARHGAFVILACRNEEKGKAAESQILKELEALPENEHGNAQFMQLDVSSLASVKNFAEAFKATYDRLDLLVNNAGIMAVPFALTVDGIESQFATNHLGHFALTAQLFDVLRKSDTARIVNVASLMHWFARMKLDRVVTPEDKYRAIEVYANSKLYNLLFMKELDRRLKAKGITNVQVMACHPGYSSTNLAVAPSTKSNWFMRFWWGIFVRLPLGQAAEMGALPTLYAATSPDAHSGEYFGPDSIMAVYGHPQLEKPINKSDSENHAARLWEESETLAQLTFSLE